MRPFNLIQGFQTPLALVHVRWLEEWNLSKLVDLYHQEKLQGYLNEKVDKAEDLIDQLMKEGRNRDQAEESAIYNILAPLRDEDPPAWPEELLNLIPEIEDSLKIDYIDLEASQNMNESYDIRESSEIRPKVGNDRASLPKRKRESSLKKHIPEIIAHFKKLHDEAEAKRPTYSKDFQEWMKTDLSARIFFHAEAKGISYEEAKKEIMDELEARKDLDTLEE